MKNGWPHLALSELTAARPICYGVLKPGERQTNGVPLIRITDITNDELDESDIYKITPALSAEFRRSVLEGNEVLLSIQGTIGRVAICPAHLKGANISRTIALIAPDKRINRQFLRYWLLSINGEFPTCGATRASLNIGTLRQLLAPIPPLQEQQRIVGILDEAFEGIATAKANAEKNLQNVRALFESHRQSIFTQRGEGWLQKSLSELCDIKHGFAFKSEFFTDSSDYVLLTPGNFYESGGYRDRGEKQKYYDGEIPDGFILSEGDLLVAMTEQAAGLLGSPILVPESGKFLHNQRLGLVTRKPGIPWTNEFFFQVFNTQAVRKEIHDSASGVKVRHTSPTKIGEVVVAFPTSLSEQKRIVSLLRSLSDETQRLASSYELKQEALDALKKSMLHQAFTGKL